MKSIFCDQFKMVHTILLKSDILIDLSDEKKTSQQMVIINSWTWDLDFLVIAYSIFQSQWEKMSVGIGFQLTYFCTREKKFLIRLGYYNSFCEICVLMAQ